MANKNVITVRVRGQLFDSVPACAEHFGLSPGTVYCALARGRPDTIGLGRAWLSDPRSTVSRSNPITLGPLHFDSESQACVTLGFSAGYLKRARQRGREVGALRKLTARAMEYEARQSKERMKHEYQENRSSAQVHDVKQQRRANGSR